MFDDDPRWGNDPRERDDDSRDRDAVDPRDVSVNKLDLPRGPERELVRDRDREYSLRGSESRADVTMRLIELELAHCDRMCRGKVHVSRS